MTIESIKQTELTANERKTLDDDRERWTRMGAGAHLKDWLDYGPGLHIRRRLAMKLAFTNRPSGRGYNEAYSQLLAADGIDTEDKSAMSCFTAVQWLHDDPERMTILQQILDEMSPGERSRLNNPISARQRVTKVLKARHGGTEDKLAMSPLKLLTHKVAERDREIAHLKEQLAAADSGSLFDLKRSNVDIIAGSIVENAGADKAKRIAKAITDRLTKRSSRPAG